MNIWNGYCNISYSQQCRPSPSNTQTHLTPFACLLFWRCTLSSQRNYIPDCNSADWLWNGTALHVATCGGIQPSRNGGERRFAQEVQQVNIFDIYCSIAHSRNRPIASVPRSRQSCPRGCSRRACESIPDLEKHPFYRSIPMVYQSLS